MAVADTFINFGRNLEVERSADDGQLASLALICLNYKTKADAEPDLRDLISASGADVTQKARREKLLRELESADGAHPLRWAKYSLERAGRLLQRWT